MSYDLNKVLKEKYKDKNTSSDEVKLDDVSRVKVLSPTRQVLKRFIRNRLAVFGMIVLLVLFLFCFLGPLFYPYGQKETFYKYDEIRAKLGVATINVTYSGYVTDLSLKIDTSVNNYMNTYIKEMTAKKINTLLKKGDDGNYYEINRLSENVFTLSKYDTKSIATFGETTVQVGTYDAMKKAFVYKDGSALYRNDEFEKIAKTLKGTSGSFTVGDESFTYKRGSGKNYDVYTTVSGFVYNDRDYIDGEMEEEFLSLSSDSPVEINGKEYIVSRNGDKGEVFSLGEKREAKIFTTLIINTYENDVDVPQELRNAALRSIGQSKEFIYNGNVWKIEEDESGVIIYDENGKQFGEFSDFVVRRTNGEDSIPFEAKMAIIEKIENTTVTADDGEMGSINISLPTQTEDGRFVVGEDGAYVYADSEVSIKKTDRNYELWSKQVKYVIDRFASPTRQHILGTDGDGFDVLARVMYGGRVSLMVGFVVVIIETLIGVVMGGLAGYYGGWVDNLIMRIVDIFYCLPTMPIMIILGSLMDAMRLPVYPRLFIMMAALGIMGWAGVARLVRGQILSFREQEFMIAAEATGIKVHDRIFRHLIPNVMPQLIVSATMGMGGTILTESTLSFLGLGVKHPLATWGTMINSVSSASAMAHYVYIWIPVGLLISFTVIAFNFVGDGLRDAFDPKGKR